MTRTELETFLATLGIPDENRSTIAQQLEKRARQLSKKRHQPYEESLTYLIFLLKQGWTSKQNKINSSS